MIMTLKEKVEEVDQSVLEKKEETLDKENLEVKNDVSLDDSCEETKKETDEEIKSEEVISNEEKKETPSIDYEGDIPFFELEPIVDSDEAVRLVNESRIAFTEFHTKTMKNTKILQIVFLIIVAGAIFAASFFPQMLTITIFLVSIYFILMFFQTKRTRKKINDYVEDYIVKYTTNIINPYLRKSKPYTMILPEFLLNHSIICGLFITILLSNLIQGKSLSFVNSVINCLLIPNISDASFIFIPIFSSISLIHLSL